MLAVKKSIAKKFILFVYYVVLIQLVSIIATAQNVGIGVITPQQRLSVANGMNIDQANANNGTIDNNVLRFGDNSGEAIGSARTGGSNNQYGLDFYTGSVKRISVTNGGDIIFVNGVTEKLRIKTNGALSIEGNTGNSGQVLQSNGNSSPSWKTIGSVIQTYYKYPPSLLALEGQLSPGGTLVFSALTHTITVSTRSRLIITAAFWGNNGSCIGCGPRSATIDIRVNGNEVVPGPIYGVMHYTAENGSSNAGEISNLFYDVNPGTYTIEFIAQNLIGGSIYFVSTYSTIIVLPID